MNRRLKDLLKIFKRFFQFSKKRKMYNLRRRRESVASVYRKTTKFLSTNTSNLLKKSPNTKKYCLLAKIVEEFQNQSNDKRNEDNNDGADEDDLGERDLDYYLGVRQKETYWRDPAGNEQIIKDYLIYHCGVTEEDYNKLFKKTSPKPSFVIQPKLKQVPFKIHKKKEKKHISFKEGVAESWAEKKGIFKLFGVRRDSDTSESYSECDSNEDAKDCADINLEDGMNENILWDLAEPVTAIEAMNKLLGVRIKEVSEGRPCDNCPEICPGFISHPWRERNHAVRRKNGNNNIRSHANCQMCAKFVTGENG